MSNQPVIRNEAQHRFELTIDGQTAELVYKLKPGVITLVHTEVPESLQGRGLAGQLAAAGLNFAREQHLRVVPECPFVAAYIKRHPENLDLLSPEDQNRVR